MKPFHKKVLSQLEIPNPKIKWIAPRVHPPGIVANPFCHPPQHHHPVFLMSALFSIKICFSTPKVNCKNTVLFLFLNFHSKTIHNVLMNMPCEIYASDS